MTSSEGVPPNEPPSPGGQPPAPESGQRPGGYPPQGAPQDYPQQGYPQQGSGEPPQKSRAWLWVLLVALVAAGVVAGIIASENKSSPVVNQQTTSTVNSLGVTVQAPQAEKTVTTPAQTVTAPPKTVTTPPKTVTTPIAPATTPKTTPTGTTP